MNRKMNLARALRVWLRLKDLAYSTGQTVYAFKHRLLSEYLPIAAQSSCVRTINTSIKS